MHLSRFSFREEDYVHPLEMTQEGISAVLGITRGHAAAELKKLRDRGHVECRFKHVPMGIRQRKVFYLTDAGIRFLSEIGEDPDVIRVSVPAVNASMVDLGELSPLVARALKA